MPMTDFRIIADRYAALGLTIPADLDLAVGYFSACQTAVNTPADDKLLAGGSQKTFTPKTIVPALHEAALNDLVSKSYGPHMQGIDHACTRLARAALGED